MKKKLIITVVCLAVVGILAGAVIALTDTPDVKGEEIPVPPKKPHAVNKTGPSVEVPHLTQEEKDTVKDAALNDPRVREVLDGREFSIKSFAPVTRKGSLEKTAGSLLLRIDNPFFIEYDWPRVYYKGEDGQRRLKETILHEAVVLDHLDIKVNLQTREVVEILPLNLHHLELADQYPESVERSNAERR